MLISSTRTGRTEVRQRPGQETRLAPIRSNLSFFWSKCTVLKKVLVTLLGHVGAPVLRRPGYCAPLAPLVTSLYSSVPELHANDCFVF